MRISSATGLVLLICMGPARAAELRTISGRVVDAQGRPVAGASLGCFWSANGPLLDQDDKPIELTTDEAKKQYWDRFEEMEPVSQRFRAESEADGRFAIEVPDHFQSLMAIDAKRTRGGLTVIPKNRDDSDVRIRLEPLVRVKGTFEGPTLGQRLAWATAVVETPADPTRPLQMRRLVLCVAKDACFMASLPPGKYLLDIGGGTDDSLREFELGKEIDLTGETQEVDLGVLRLAQAKQTVYDKIKKSQASGALGDYTKHYGEKAPAWNVVDARGVREDAQLSDFEGKWVLLEFWALNCSACLKRDLPKLAKFYNDHEAQRDQFEILAICVDCDGELKSVAEVDRALEPIIKHAWGGEPLPFPLLLDPSMTTLERFGVPGYQTVLIDPEGRFAEGDETVLAEKLRKP